MRHDLFKISMFLLLLLSFTGGAVKAHALSVNDIRLGLHPDKTRMVVELSEVSKFRVFVLEDPWRMVIDMPQFDWRVGNISRPSASAVTAVRQGQLKPGISRVVIDLSKPVIVDRAFLLRQDGAKPNRLVIDFRPVNEGQYRAHNNRVHGILDVDDIGNKAIMPKVETKSAMIVPPKPPEKTAPEQTPEITAAALGLPVVPSKKPVASAPPVVPKKVQQKPLIIIDPGHGGVDPGAIGANGVFEKHVVLSMAKELKSLLESSGKYRVMLTRRSDRYLKLYQRVDVARQNNADLFISLHADSIDKPSVRGASIYTLSEKASDKQTARLAERENKADIIAGADLSHEDHQVANILIDLAMRDTMNQSKFLANTMVGSMGGAGIKMLERPHRYAGFAVLKAPDVPSILVEIGFMSNRSEAKMLSQSSYRRKIANALKAGIDSYFEKVNRNNRI